MRWKPALQFAAAGIAVAALAGCGTVTGGTAAPSAQASQQGGEQNAAQDEPGIVTLAATETEALGTIVTDGQGMTLYRFDDDTAKPPKSNCDGDCATAWPPLIAGEAGIEVQGIDKTLVGTVERSDGSTQVTLAGWPLYHYAKDKAPGDVNGHGAGGRWFAATPEGKKAGVAAAAPGTVPAGQPVTLVVMSVAPLGEIVTDREGMTLYRFDKDTNDPATSNCNGDCAAQWPPVIATSDEFQLQGIDKALVGTVQRADGSRQVTIAGWPVYRFAGDKVPCDTNGQGVGGVWFAVTATGKKAAA